MLVQQLIRTDPEKVLINVKNTDASSLTTGYAVSFAGGDAVLAVSADGVNALLLGTSANTGQQNFAGIAYKDIAANAYGLVQSYGFCASVALSAEANKTIGVLNGASLLKISAVAGLLTSTLAPEAISTYLGKYVLNALTTNISGGIPYTSAFVRAV